MKSTKKSKNIYYIYDIWYLHKCNQKTHLKLLYLNRKNFYFYLSSFIFGYFYFYLSRFLGSLLLLLLK